MARGTTYARSRTTGRGIPDWMNDKIFNRLQRGTPKAHSKGLGSYIVKSLVKDYRGNVWSKTAYRAII
jgi:signal transduction histidine kinase